MLVSKYQKIYIGSITDGTKRIEIHITTFYDNDTRFAKGQTIDVVGEYVNRYEGNPYLNVNTIGKMTLLPIKKIGISNPILYHESRIIILKL